MYFCKKIKIWSSETMHRYFSIYILSVVLTVSNCGTVYIPQILPEARGVGASVGQETIDVEVIQVTEASLKTANLSPYIRRVIDASDLTQPAKLVSAEEAINQRLPDNNDAGIYKLGIGDILTISQMLDVDTGTGFLRLFTERKLAIADDGFVSIFGVGRVALSGLSQFEAEDLIYSQFVSKQITPDFELTIFDFRSKKIYLSIINGGQGKVQNIPYTNTPIYLHQLLASVQSPVQKGQDNLVSLKRGVEEYRMSFKSIINGDLPNVRVFPEDRVFVEPLPYRKETAILAGEVNTPKLISLSAFERPSLAEALYETGGMFLTNSSDTSQVYIIRRKQNEVLAYHLDVSNPSRLSLATKFELRPNDIIYVAPQAITNWNRALTQVLTPILSFRGTF